MSDCVINCKKNQSISRQAIFKKYNKPLYIEKIQTFRRRSMVPDASFST